MCNCTEVAHKSEATVLADDLNKPQKLCVAMGGRVYLSGHGSLTEYIHIRCLHVPALLEMFIM